MSGTIRRKTVKTPEWWHNHFVRGTMVNNRTRFGSQQWDKEEAQFHNDKYQPWAKIKKQPEYEFRVAAKRELNKAMNDPEYEVQVRRGRNLNRYD